jgi:hypothetical protein
VLGLRRRCVHVRGRARAHRAPAQRRGGRSHGDLAHLDARRLLEVELLYVFRVRCRCSADVCADTVQMGITAAPDAPLPSVSTSRTFAAAADTWPRDVDPRTGQYQEAAPLVALDLYSFSRLRSCPCSHPPLALVPRTGARGYTRSHARARVYDVSSASEDDMPPPLGKKKKKVSDPASASDPVPAPLAGAPVARSRRPCRPSRVRANLSRTYSPQPSRPTSRAKKRRRLRRQRLLLVREDFGRADSTSVRARGIFYSHFALQDRSSLLS